MPHCEVREPHFEPLLIDSLAEDVFAKLGHIVRLNDFADFPGPTLDRTFFMGANVISLVLSGERDRAAEFVAQYQNDDRHTGAAKELIRQQWERVSGDIEKVCEEFRAREAATIKALKLEHVWEPSPFPVELPPAERARVSEPAFSLRPWMPRPQWLLGEAPVQPGEVRFGKEVHTRNGHELLVVPLTREDAEKRHHASETYATTERLTDASLLVIRRVGGNFEIQGKEYKLPTGLHIRWINPPYVLQVHPMRDLGDDSMISFWSFSVRDQVARKEIWRSSVRVGETSTHDWRKGEQAYSSRDLTTAEREIARCPMPGFADHTDLVARIRSLVEITGYGPWP
jgi:hypothetical protein